MGTLYEKGATACRTGKRVRDNPYNRQSKKALEWARGYADQARKEAATAKLGLKYLGKGVQGEDIYEVPADFFKRVENFK